MPTEETLGTLLRWWAGDPSDESEARSRYADPVWAWIRRLPAEHEGRRLVKEWRTRCHRLVRKVDGERELRFKAASVVIDVSEEQQRFIAELRRLIEETGLEDESWLVFGRMTLAVNRYL
ncbi:hypothetical protein ACFWNE_29165 [Streptomyces goshikiensis]|uniref:hypothetical protein n=1 Tax=Streptomyces goshikiensis TaxID=1942 RepID=UPI00365CAC04